MALFYFSFYFSVGAFSVYLCAPHLSAESDILQGGIDVRYRVGNRGGLLYQVSSWREDCMMYLELTCLWKPAPPPKPLSVSAPKISVIGSGYEDCGGERIEERHFVLEWVRLSL